MQDLKIQAIDRVLNHNIGEVTIGGSELLEKIFRHGAWARCLSCSGGRATSDDEEKASVVRVCEVCEQGKTRLGFAESIWRSWTTARRERRW